MADTQLYVPKESLFEVIARLLGPKSREKLTISPRRRLFASSNTNIPVSSSINPKNPVSLTDILAPDNAIYIEWWAAQLNFTSVADTFTVQGFDAEIQNASNVTLLSMGGTDNQVFPTTATATSAPFTTWKVQPPSPIVTFWDLTQWAALQAVAFTQPLVLNTIMSINNSATAAIHVLLSSWISYRFISGVEEG